MIQNYISEVVLISPANIEKVSASLMKNKKAANCKKIKCRTSHLMKGLSSKIMKIDQNIIGAPSSSPLNL